MFKKFVALILSSTAFLSSMHAYSQSQLAGEDLSIVAKKFSRSKFNHIHHGKLKIYFTDISASGDFSFRFIIVGPDGKSHKTKLFKTSDLATKAVITIRPTIITGPYFIYTKVESVTTNGSGLFKYFVANPVFDNIYTSFAGFTANSTTVGRRVYSGSFNVP